VVVVVVARVCVRVCVKRIKQNKIEKVQSPSRATTAQECPHRRENLKRKNYTSTLKQVFLP
jgi:hypothetical protein